MEKGLTSKQLKALAREQLIGRYGIAITVTILVMLIEIILTAVSSGINNGYDPMSVIMGFVISLVINLLMGVLIYGQVHVYLKIARGDETINFMDLFHGIKHNLDKSIMIQGIFTLFAIVSSIPSLLVGLRIVVIPDTKVIFFTTFTYFFAMAITIAAKLFFGLSFYILDDTPEASAKEVLSKSLSLMKKKKGRLLYIYLSFIPLLILGSFACFVGIFFVMAYQETVLANFYLDASGQSKPFIAPVPTRDYLD